jgi:hypothetical protein
MSAMHYNRPIIFELDGKQLEAKYTPGESDTELFGGNSNWRGPIWFPVNYLLIEALEKYGHYYGEELKIELPGGGGPAMTLKEVSLEISRRLVTLFLKQPDGRRVYEGDSPPPWRDLLLFNEYFHGDTGKGLGASHQTGWTALVVRLMENLAREQRRKDDLKSSDQPRWLQSV